MRVPGKSAPRFVPVDTISPVLAVLAVLAVLEEQT